VGLGLAMVNLGDIAYQTVAGATSTATHGTGGREGRPGRRHRRHAHRHRRRIGVQCSATEEPEVFPCARVGVGAIGAVSQVTLQVAPAFNLRAIEEPMKLDDVLANLDEHVDGNDHFEFFWVPHTRWALTKRNNTTSDPVGGRSRVREFRTSGSSRTSRSGRGEGGQPARGVDPKLARMAPGTGKVEYVNRSYKVFASPRHVRFTEMEYAIAREALPRRSGDLSAWLTRRAST